MILTQRCNLETSVASLGIQHGPRVTCISTVDPQAVKEDATHGRSTEVTVVVTSIYEAIMDIGEGIPEVSRDALAELPRARILGEVLVLSKA